MRSASLTRKTSETEITLTLTLEGSGQCTVKTGVGFFDHMLEQIARHANLDLSIEARGDTHIDDHHTVEDVGIVLGQAVMQALGDKKGIARYGSAYVPMDESLCRAVLDISGRSVLVFEASFASEKIGTFDVALVEEFFQAFARSGFTLHLACLYGKNAHHQAEGIFKAFARALKQAITIDGEKIPSTKGVL